MKINNLPEKYERIWEKALPLLKTGRPGDDKHAAEVVEFMLNYKGGKKLDFDILIPTAMMHDIGHSAVLPEHIKYLSGEEKLPNAKLVHMLAGAKIAKEILEKVDYDGDKSKEIVEIISIHDMDQVKGVDSEKYYNSENKKLFHDIDCLDRYTGERLKSMKKLAPTKTEKELVELVKKEIGAIFSEEFREVAEKRVRELEEMVKEKKNGL